MSEDDVALTEEEEAIMASSTEAAGEDEVVPYRMQINFTGAHLDADYLVDIMAAVIEEAESRGLFFEYAHMSEMEEDAVIAGSPLYKVLTGRD